MLKRFLPKACIAFFAVIVVLPVNAQQERTQKQEISQSHLNAAFETVFITRTSRAYNEIIPNLAQRARVQMLKKRPDLKPVIDAAIDEIALELVDQQGELDLLIARSWAERFTEEELFEISAFYSTPTGSKLAKRNTELIAVGLDIARRWGAEKGLDLVQRVQAKLKAEGHDF